MTKYLFSSFPKCLITKAYCIWAPKFTQSFSRLIEKHKAPGKEAGTDTVKPEKLPGKTPGAC